MALGISSDLKLGLVVITATLFTSSLTAPSPSLIKPSPDSDPWWFNPCNGYIIKTRHSRSTSVDQMQKQLQIFISQLKKNKQEIKNMYNKPQGKVPQFRWLKIKKWVKRMNMLNSRKHESAALEFHKDLQYFAGTLERLINQNVRTDVTNFNQSKRKKIFINIKENLKGLLCEVQDSLLLNNKNIVIPKIAIKTMKIKLPKEVNYTNAYLFDRAFFDNATKFFNRTRKLFKKKRKGGENVTRTEKSAVQKHKRM